MTNENQLLAKFENLGDYWEPMRQYWFPTYTTWVNHQDTFAQAFKIVSMMIEKGYLDKITLKKFIKLVKEVEGEL